MYRRLASSNTVTLSSIETNKSFIVNDISVRTPEQHTFYVGRRDFEKKSIALSHYFKTQECPELSRSLVWMDKQGWDIKDCLELSKINFGGLTDAEFYYGWEKKYLYI